MTTFAQAAVAIRTRIETQWATLAPTMGGAVAAQANFQGPVQLVWANEPRPTFDEEPYVVHVEVRGGAAKIVAFGGAFNNRHRQSGEVLFRCFVPAGEGDGNARALASAAAATVRGWTNASPEIRFFDVSEMGGEQIDENGAVFEFDVMASFTFDLIG